MTEELKPIPKNTFSEAVIVDGHTFYIGQWFNHPVEIDTVVVPFTDKNGRKYSEWTSYPCTLSSARKSVIDYIKRCEVTKNFERRKSSPVEDALRDENACLREEIQRLTCASK